MPHDGSDSKTVAAQDDVRRVHDVLRGMPLIERLSALAVSLVYEEPFSVFALQSLIRVALMMAKHLPPSEQTAVRWHLQNAIEELQARWN